MARTRVSFDPKTGVASRKMPSILLESLRSERPTMPLYHYTSTEGLIGIVKSKSLRASAIQFLNDTAEYQHAASVTTKLLGEYIYLGGGPPQRICDRLLAVVPYASGIAFAGSLSEEKDKLSQWRGFQHWLCPMAYRTASKEAGVRPSQVRVRSNRARGHLQGDHCPRCRRRGGGPKRPSNGPPRHGNGKEAGQDSGGVSQNVGGLYRADDANRARPQESNLRGRKGVESCARPILRTGCSAARPLFQSREIHSDTLPQLRACGSGSPPRTGRDNRRTEPRSRPSDQIGEVPP